MQIRPTEQDQFKDTYWGKAIVGRQQSDGRQPNPERGTGSPCNQIQNRDEKRKKTDAGTKAHKVT